MVSTSVAPWHICSYPISRLHSNGSRLSNRRAFTTCSPSKPRTHFKNNCSLFLTSTNSCTPHQDKKNNTSYFSQNHIFLEQLHSSIATDKVTKQAHKTGNEEDREETAAVFKDKLSISTNMWWADLKAALSQRINLEGLVSSVAVVAKDRHLALPHIAVPDIRYIDWAELKREGFRGVVFDKDNTITVPYSLTLWAPLGSSLERCKSIFGNDIAVFSNSAGLRDYDPDGRKARALEGAIGIKVISHSVKKPAGTAEEIEKHFGCESSRLVMVGDRPFTDVVYGNRNGFLTVLTEPLSLAEEPFIVKQVRKVEIALVNRWSRRGLKPANHRLLPDVMRCVKDPPVL